MAAQSMGLDGSCAIETAAFLVGKNILGKHVLLLLLLRTLAPAATNGSRAWAITFMHRGTQMQRSREHKEHAAHTRNTRQGD